MKAKQEPVVVKVFPSDISIAMSFTRKELRRYAKQIGVKTGRDKMDTAWNILESGNSWFEVSLWNNDKEV